MKRKSTATTNTAEALLIWQVRESLGHVLITAVAMVTIADSVIGKHIGT